MKQKQVYCFPLYLLPSQILHSCFLGWPCLWPGREGISGPLPHAPGGDLVSVTGGSQPCSPALGTDWGLGPKPVHLAWLCSCFLAKSQGFSSRPRLWVSSYFFPSKRALCQVYTEFPFSFLCGWNIIINAFFPSLILMCLRRTGSISGSTLISWTGNLSFFPLI